MSAVEQVRCQTIDHRAWCGAARRDCRSNSVQRRRLHVGAARRGTRRAAQRSRARDCTGGEEVLPALLPRRM